MKEPYPGIREESKGMDHVWRNDFYLLWRQILRRCRQRLYGGGQSDALQRFSAQMIQPCQRKHQVRAPFGIDQGVQFVDDAWLETNDHVRWLKGNKYFTWESERDGWRHLDRKSVV